VDYFELGGDVIMIKNSTLFSSGLVPQLHAKYYLSFWYLS